METLSTITILPANKKQREIYVKNVKEEILSGNRNPNEIIGYIKSGVEVLTSILKDDEIKDYCIQEMREDKILNFAGHSVERSTRRSFDFSSCEKWIVLENEIQKLKAEQKLLEGQMKFLKNDIADTSTGEIISPAIIKSEINVLTIKLK
jgi:hypothetical protein